MTLLITRTSIRIGRLFAFAYISLLAQPVSATEDYTVELYETYCSACHGVSGAGAPIAFDIEEWDERMRKGVDVVVNNAINGLGNMPAQGLCQECTYQDFEDLTRYMSMPK